MRFPYESEVALQRYEEIKQLCSEKYPDLTVYLGNEMYGYLESVDTLASGQFHPLGNSRVALVEFANDIGYRDMCNVLQSYRAAGYRPMLAHAERCACLVNDITRVYELAAMRVLIQINASALRHTVFPNRITRFVRNLLDEELVAVISSDAHGVEQRSPHMLFAYTAVERRYGSKAAEKLFYENPVRILQGE
jgi:protein-tyrosine phosphatase